MRRGLRARGGSVVFVWEVLYTFVRLRVVVAFFILLFLFVFSYS